VVLTDHDAVDIDAVIDSATVVFDTRNAVSETCHDDVVHL
jgi:UDP-N-acetyl-D-mannosaminuronate dehydrogenase